VRILLVAYFYPPCRDTGAARPGSMARHLRALGHEVQVLTTSAYGEGADDEAEVTRTTDAQLWRARLRGRRHISALYDADAYGGKPHFLSRVVVPEPLALAWAPFARARALSLHRERHFDCVITTSPPESAHLVGRALRRRGVPWVADVRDAWTFEPLRPAFPTGVQRRLDRRLERRLLGAADVVVCVSQAAADDLRKREIADPLLIANGWDPPAGQVANSADRFAHLDPARRSLVYTGRFGSYGRDPSALVEGLARLAGEDPKSAASLELVVAGPLTADESQLFHRDVSPARINLLGSVDRASALALQRAADALLVIAQPTRSQLLNYKLFEYFAAERPVLALAAGTEAGRLAGEIGATVVAADDPVAIARALGSAARGELRRPPAGAAAPYTYPQPAAAMARAAELAIARAGGTVPRGSDTDNESAFV
jgi:glycosyltransferase involved in cell wall biosynthesis